MYALAIDEAAAAGVDEEATELDAVAGVDVELVVGTALEVVERAGEDDEDDAVEVDLRVLLELEELALVDDVDDADDADLEELLAAEVDARLEEAEDKEFVVDSVTVEDAIEADVEPAVNESTAQTPIRQLPPQS